MGLRRVYKEWGVGVRSFAQHVIVYNLISTCIVIWFLSFYRRKYSHHSHFTGEEMDVNKVKDSNPGHSSSMHGTTLPLRGQGTHIQQQPWKMSQTKWVGQLIKILHAKQSDNWTDKGQAVWPANDREANKSKIKFEIFFSRLLHSSFTITK